MSSRQPASQKPLDVFVSYAHKDEELRQELENHLTALKKQPRIRTWNDRKITAGSEWAGKIDKNLMAAEIILLLVSSNFLASEYCWDIEVEKALERHDTGQARVIPVILRPADWRETPIGKLQALPKDGEPVTSWGDQDKAFMDVVEGLRAVIDEMSSNKKPRSVSGSPPGLEIVVGPSSERPSTTTRQSVEPTPTNTTGSATVLRPRDPGIPRSKVGKPGIRPKYRHGVRGTRPLGRHEGSIYAMAWSADGKILASSSVPNTIKLWDFASSKLIRQFDSHEGLVLGLAWSPQGDLLASASADHTIRLWQHDAEGQLRVLAGHNKSVTSLAWSPDGTGLCSASTDCSIRLWDVVSGRKLGIVGHHDDSVYSLAWSARGHLASGGCDSVVRIWKPEINASPRTSAKDEHRGIVYAVVWSHRGNLLASASADKTIRIWDAKRLKLKKMLTGHRDRVRCLAFSSCDRLLASKSDDGTVRLWRCDDWTEVAEFQEENDVGNVGGLAFHPNRPVLATRDDRSHAVRVWHLDLKELGLGAALR